MRTRTNDDRLGWPEHPSWGFAALFLIGLVIALVLVWVVNYRQAFGG